jgi:hypothetical protein
MDYSQFINIGVENLVHESNAGAFVRVLVWQFDVNLPDASSKGG